MFRSLGEILYPATQDAINVHLAEMKDRFRLKVLNEIKQNPEGISSFLHASNIDTCFAVRSIPIKSPVFIIGNQGQDLHYYITMDPLTRTPLLYDYIFIFYYILFLFYLIYVELYKYYLLYKYKRERWRETFSLSLPF